MCSVNVVLFGQKWLYLGKAVVFDQKWLYSGKSGCKRAKWLVFGQNCFVIGQKWLY